jgi:hypothetical protein
MRRGNTRRGGWDRWRRGRDRGTGGPGRNCLRHDDFWRRGRGWIGHRRRSLRGGREWLRLERRGGRERFFGRRGNRCRGRKDGRGHGYWRDGGERRWRLFRRGPGLFFCDRKGSRGLGLCGRRPFDTWGGNQSGISQRLGMGARNWSVNQRSDGLLDASPRGRNCRGNLCLEFADNSLEVGELPGVFAGQVVQLFAQPGIPNVERNSQNGGGEQD